MIVLYLLVRRKKVEYVALFVETSYYTGLILKKSCTVHLVDGSIHGFHHFIRSGRTRRPVGINLIDGHLDFVIDFLDKLTYGSGSTPGIQQTLADW